MWRIGIDVGGTFTDLVAVDRRGRTVIAKAPSTPADPSLGVLDGLERLARALGTTLAPLLAEHRSHRPRHDRRHQRAAHARRRAGRPAGDRGPSRRPRDARGSEGRALRSAPAASRTAGAARRGGSACASASGRKARC
jgi:hypothetical protein